MDVSVKETPALSPSVFGLLNSNEVFQSQYNLIVVARSMGDGLKEGMCRPRSFH